MNYSYKEEKKGICKVLYKVLFAKNKEKLLLKGKKEFSFRVQK